MPITDLTGTKWLFNEAPENAWGEPYNISFTSNNENFVALYADEDDLYGSGRGLKYFTTTPSGSPYDFVHAYNSRTGVWANQSYRTIEITGGTDTTNATLISWLQSNATQIVEPTETNTFSIGNIPVTNMYVGTRQVRKIYIGNVLVWEKETEPVPDNALLVQDGKLFTSSGGYLITTEVNLISFDILGDTYQAEEGMTWAEWCASEYNTDGYKVGGDGKIYNSISTSQVTSGSPVSSSDIIHANVSYNRLGVGGADQ